MRGFILSRVDAEPRPQQYTRFFFVSSNLQPPHVLLVYIPCFTADARLPSVYGRYRIEDALSRLE